MKLRNILITAVGWLASASLAHAQATNNPAADVDFIKVERIRPIGDWQVDPAETEELNQIYATALSSANAIAPGPDYGAQRRAVDNALRQEIENFLSDHPNSAYAPSLHLTLARRAQLRCGYSLALEHYRKTVSLLKGSPDPTAQIILLEASGGLAKLLAVTGQIGELDELVALLAQPGTDIVPGSEWTWAREMRAYVLKHPTESFKCGLYCLDMLGRTTQPGQFLPKNVTETISSTNGFTAADLLAVAAQAGLKVHAAAFTDTNNIPNPCVLHLQSEHFVFIGERRGAFYEVRDPIAFGTRWLTADEIVAEATGCVLVSDVVPPLSANTLIPIDASTASQYRGRCHSPAPYDHDDLGCGDDGDGGDGRGGRGGGCGSCGLPSAGMPSYIVSEPFLNMWVKDVPLEYSSAYGLPVRVELAHLDRHYQSVVSGWSWQGAEFGNDQGQMSLWSCSLLSYAELSSDGSTVELMLPGKGWATFSFPTNAGVSSTSYRTEMWMEQQGPGPVGSVTNLVLHYPDGSTANYGVYNKTDTWYAGVFFMTTLAGPDGVQTQFSYNSSHYLTTVTAADGTTFTLQYGNGSFPDAITGVTTSYGASVSFGYVGAVGAVLSTITDAAGMTSQIQYYSPNYGDTVTGLVTPYGTTLFSIFGQSSGATSFGVFDRTLEITNAIGTKEFYGQMNNYISNSWPDYATSQIPTNTPVGTLDKDTASRQERNTFYWNGQQFASLIGKDFWTFDWPQFKQARIRHWLANTNQTYTHFDTLSLAQDPSPDGGTTEGQITWYDYVGKPSGVDYEVGTQILLAVVARVMPDGSTWYQSFKRLPNGVATNVLEAWMDSGTVHSRSNVYVYASNGIDLLSWTNPLGVRVLNNAYNSIHQVLTSYDALGQLTTNGYDATTHLITSSSFPSGLVTLYSYNGSHRLQSVVDLPVNRTNSYTWNSDGTTATQTDPRNMVETYYWDALHRVTGTSDARGTTTNLYYLLSGVPYANSYGGTAILDLTATRDRLGQWTSYVYDALRRKVAETNANGVVTAYGYCPCGAVSSITNAWNTAIQEVTTLNLDTQSRLTSTVYADSYSVTNWYDLLGHVVVTGNGAANHWLFYNNLDLLTVRSNAYGAELTQSYDLLGRPVYVTDANGVMTTNTYDYLSRLLTRGYPDGGVERFGYSAKGLIAYTNQINLTNFYAYDELARKTYETNANGEILKYTNNAAGDLLSLTDGKNQITQWKYDQFGQVTNKLDQAGTVILKYIYDPNDRLTNRWSAAMGTTTYTYDNFGNLKSILYPHSPSQTYSYDSLNRLTNMVDANGITKYTYTAGNQLWTEVQGSLNSTVTNMYVNRLRTLLTLQQHTGWPLWTNTFAYDAAARLTNITSPAGVFSYTRGGANSASTLIKKLALPNTAYVTNKFDSVGRLVSTYLDNSVNTVLDSAIYGYNLANQRTAFTNAAGTYVLYSYDPIGQLKVADSSVNTEDRGYFYDAAWNLNRLTNNGTASTFSVDGKNQLTADPNSGTDTYDANANLVQRTVSGVNLVYGYDDENRLTNIVYGTTYNSSFYYDGLSRLRFRQDYFWTGTNWYPLGGAGYIYDGKRVVQERNSSGSPLVSYTRGTDLSGSLEGAGGIGGLLARSSGYSSGNWTTHHFYHADGSGNITYLVDSSQAMAATYRYDPFGNTVSSSGTMASTNLYRFSSREIYPNNGMYAYLYRFYDPSLQRWLNRDPASLHKINLYEFVHNVPTGSVDPWGLQMFGFPILGNPILANPILENPVLEDPILEGPILDPIPEPVTPNQPPITIPIPLPPQVPPMPLPPVLQPPVPKPPVLPKPTQPPHGQPSPKDPICGPQFNPPPKNNRTDTCTLDHSDGMGGCYYNCEHMGYSYFPANAQGNCPDEIHPDIQQEE